MGDNIRYYHLNVCVSGRKSIYALSLLVVKQEFNPIKVSCRSVNHLLLEVSSIVEQAVNELS